MIFFSGKGNYNVHFIIESERDESLVQVCFIVISLLIMRVCNHVGSKAFLKASLAFLLTCTFLHDRTERQVIRGGTTIEESKGSSGTQDASGESCKRDSGMHGLVGLQSWDFLSSPSLLYPNLAYSILT